MGRRQGRVFMGAAIAIGALATSSLAEARPVAPQILCETYAGAPACIGASPECTTCHVSTTPVKMNAFGTDVSAALGAYTAKPYTDDSFREYLPFALTDVEGVDSDGDDITNVDELLNGTLPGDENSVPGEATCPDDVSDLDYKICEYDLSYAYRKVSIDFCGLPPTFEEMEEFRALSAEQQDDRLHDQLDTCLDTQFWMGFNGVLWSIAHEKIRPLGAFFQDGTNFFFDYGLFAWASSDGHDVRDLLVADYLVAPTTPNGEDDLSVIGYQQIYDVIPTMQPMQPERRAGMLTLAWPLFYNTMFTALPRTTAAQAYRAFLGLDIAKSEGLDWAVEGEPVDYDNKGVGYELCAQCHSTLDPLAYPFATYNGIQTDNGAFSFFMYDPNRVEKHFADEFPDMLDMPEAGVIFGQPVADLLEWAQVAANSDQFFIATTKDYWKLLIGEEPRPDDEDSFDEFNTLWQGLSEHHSVEDMLHDLIDTEAYGAP